MTQEGPTSEERTSESDGNEDDSNDKGKLSTSLNWFGPRRRRSAIPEVQRDKRHRKSFNWETKTGTKALLRRIPRFDDEVVLLLTGVPVPILRPGKLEVLANTELAEEFVEYVSANIRGLNTTLVETEERSVGELRGPINWSATLSARSASYGTDATYVSRAQVRTYDSPENRVLVAALTRIADSVPTKWADKDSDDRALRVAGRARLLLGQRPLHKVAVLPMSKLSADKKRARNGRKKDFYRPALDVLDAEPRSLSHELVGPDDILSLCDPTTRSIHRVVVEVHKKLVSLELAPPDIDPFLVVKGKALTLGGIRFRGGKSGFVSFGGVEIATPRMMKSLSSKENPRSDGEKQQDVRVIAHPDDLSSVLVAVLQRNALRG